MQLLVFNPAYSTYLTTLRSLLPLLPVQPLVSNPTPSTFLVWGGVVCGDFFGRIKVTLPEPKYNMYRNPLQSFQQHPRPPAHALIIVADRGGGGALVYVFSIPSLNESCSLLCRVCHCLLMKMLIVWLLC